MNKVILIGRVGGEPKTTTHENGKKVTKFSLATNEFFGDKKVTTWHNIDIWGDYGVKMSQFLKTGSQVALEGRIANNAYEKDGEKRIYSSVVCDRIELQDTKKTNETAHTSEYNQSNDNNSQSSAPTISNIDIDDLPF